MVLQSQSLPGTGSGGGTPRLSQVWCLEEAGSLLSRAQPRKRSWLGWGPGAKTPPHPSRGAALTPPPHAPRRLHSKSPPAPPLGHTSFGPSGTQAPNRQRQGASPSPTGGCWPWTAPASPLAGTPLSQHSSQGHERSCCGAGGPPGPPGACRLPAAPWELGGGRVPRGGWAQAQPRLLSAQPAPGPSFLESPRLQSCPAPMGERVSGPEEQGLQRSPRDLVPPLSPGLEGAPSWPRPPHAG